MKMGRKHYTFLNFLIKLSANAHRNYQYRVHCFYKILMQDKDITLKYFEHTTGNYGSTPIHLLYALEKLHWKPTLLYQEALFLS